MKFMPLAYIPILALPFGVAQAASIAITNHNFETDGVEDGSFTNNPGVAPTGWTTVGGKMESA